MLRKLASSITPRLHSGSTKDPQKPPQPPHPPPGSTHRTGSSSRSTTKKSASATQSRHLPPPPPPAPPTCAPLLDGLFLPPEIIIPTFDAFAGSVLSDPQSLSQLIASSLRDLSQSGNQYINNNKLPSAVASSPGCATPSTPTSSIITSTNTVLTYLSWGIKHIEKAVAVLAHSSGGDGAAREHLQKAEQMLRTLTDSMQDIDHAALTSSKVPNSRCILAAAHVFLALVWKLRNTCTRYVATHLLQAFVVCPRNVRQSYVPELWRQVFQPHLSAVEAWYRKERNNILYNSSRSASGNASECNDMVPPALSRANYLMGLVAGIATTVTGGNDSANAESVKRSEKMTNMQVKLLVDLYEESLDEGTQQYAKHYQDLLASFFDEGSDIEELGRQSSLSEAANSVNPQSDSDIRDESKPAQLSVGPRIILPQNMQQQSTAVAAPRGGAEPPSCACACDAVPAMAASGVINAAPGAQKAPNQLIRKKSLSRFGALALIEKRLTSGNKKSSSTNQVNLLSMCNKVELPEVRDPRQQKTNADVDKSASSAATPRQSCANSSQRSHRSRRIGASVSGSSSAAVTPKLAANAAGGTSSRRSRGGHPRLIDLMAHNSDSEQKLVMAPPVNKPTSSDQRRVSTSDVTEAADSGKKKLTRGSSFSKAEGALLRKKGGGAQSQPAPRKSSSARRTRARASSSQKTSRVHNEATRQSSEETWMTTAAGSMPARRYRSAPRMRPETEKGGENQLIRELREAVVAARSGGRSSVARCEKALLKLAEAPWLAETSSATAERCVPHLVPLLSEIARKNIGSGQSLLNVVPPTPLHCSSGVSTPTSAKFSRSRSSLVARSVALVLISRLLLAVDYSINRQACRHVLFPEAIPCLLESLQPGVDQPDCDTSAEKKSVPLDERAAAASILTCCMQAHQDCRRTILPHIRVSTLVSLLQESAPSMSAFRIAISFVTEVLCSKYRKTHLKEMLHRFREDGMLNCMHALMAYLQIVDVEDQPAAAGLLLQLDLLLSGNDDRYNVFREEALELLLTPIVKNDNEEAIMNATQVLSTIGTKHSRREMESWLLRKAGLTSVDHYKERHEIYVSESEGEEDEDLDEELMELSGPEYAIAVTRWDEKVVKTLMKKDGGELIAQALSVGLCSNLKEGEVRRACLLVVAWLTSHINLNTAHNPMSTPKCDCKSPCTSHEPYLFTALNCLKLAIHPHLHAIAAVASGFPIEDRVFAALSLQNLGLHMK